MRGDLSAICRVLREKDRFLVACHENPEGDAIGSELALALALRKLGKTATVLNADPVPANLLFLPGADTVVFDEDGCIVRFDVGANIGMAAFTGAVVLSVLRLADHDPAILGAAVAGGVVGDRLVGSEALDFDR